MSIETKVVLDADQSLLRDERIIGLSTTDRSTSLAFNRCVSDKF